MLLSSTTANLVTELTLDIAGMTAEARSDGLLDRPLRGMRVIECVSGPMALVGRLLADLGADVVRVAPIKAGIPAHSRCVAAGVDIEELALNRGKALSPLCLENASDLPEFADLIRSADIFIEDCSQTSVLSDILDVTKLRSRHPALVVLSISDFGRTNGFQGWSATAPVLYALSGVLSRSGIPGRPPLLPPEALASRCAATQAAFVALLAFYDRLESGVGGWLDFSILDGVVQTLDPGYGAAGSAAAGGGILDQSWGRPDVRHRYPIIPCSNGHVRICILAPRQWRGMFEWMGSPEEFSDPSYDVLINRFNSPNLLPAITRFFANKSREEIDRQGQHFGVPTAIVLDGTEAIETQQNIARDVFAEVAIGPTAVARLPHNAIEIDSHRLTVGEAADRAELPRAAAAEPIAALTTRALAGLKVLDLGVIVVGAETGRLFADAGADVVKIENAAFPDGLRQTRDGSLISPSFAAGHRNKRSLMLDLRQNEGRARFLDLLRQCDVLVSNFKPGTLPSLGLDSATLFAANPRLALIDSSAFGPRGPESCRLGYGPLVRATTGASAAWSYPGEAGSFADASTVYPDHVAARLGALTALALLIRRKRTGAGGIGSIAQAEIVLEHLGVDTAYRELAKAGHTVSSDPADSPWGIYACAGEDDWCVVTIRGDEDWQRLAPLLGLADQLVLQNRSGRIERRLEIDAALGKWMATRSSGTAMQHLQQLGVPAGAMLRVSEMPTCDYYRARKFFKLVDHPSISTPFFVEARPVSSDRLEDPENKPAPLIGEHGEAVLRDWLALDDATIHGLIDRGILGGLDTRTPAETGVDQKRNTAGPLR